MGRLAQGARIGQSFDTFVRCSLELINTHWDFSRCRPTEGKENARRVQITGLSREESSASGRTDRRHLRGADQRF